MTSLSPHNLEAERSVLGAILIDNDTFNVAAAILDARAFFRDAHRRIFERMMDLSERSQPIDLVTLKEELERAGDLEEVGGPAYVASLVDGVPRSTNVEYYAQIVKEKATRRRLLVVARTLEEGANHDDDLGDLADRVSAHLQALQSPSGGSVDHTQLELELSRERARREARRRLDLAELGDSGPLVFHRLDQLLSADVPPVQYVVERLQPKGSKVLFAAQAKAGKTTTVINLIRALVDGVPFLGQFAIQSPPGNICLIDMEMSESQLHRWFKDAGIRNADRVRIVQLRGRARDFNLTDPTVLTRWVADLKREEVGYLIFDNLRPLLDACGLDENRDAGRFLVLYDRLIADAEVHASMIVHHMGHNGDRSRGDSRLRDWPDVEWKLTRQRNDKNEVEDPDSPRFFSCYGRDVHLPESQLEYDSGLRHLTLVGGNRRDVALDDAVVQIYDVLDDRQLSQRGVEDACKTAGVAIGRDTVRKALDHGVRGQALVHAKGPRNADFYSRGPNPPVRGTARALRGRTSSECAGTYRVPRTRAVDDLGASAPTGLGHEQATEVYRARI